MKLIISTIAKNFYLSPILGGAAGCFVALLAISSVCADTCFSMSGFIFLPFFFCILFSIIFLILRLLHDRFAKVPLLKIEAYVVNDGDFSFPLIKIAIFVTAFAVRLISAYLVFANLFIICSGKFILIYGVN